MRRSLDAGDSAALQAALSLLDDMRDDRDVDDWLFGRDDGSSGDASVEDDTVSATATAVEEAAAAAATRRPARKRQRNRRKDEIAYLRSKVTELERVLAATSARTAEAQGIPTRELELVSIWQELALRQRRKRLASESENAALREMLASQVQVARGLLQFLERQPREEDIPGVRALRQLQIAAVEPVDLSHDEILRRMDALYSKVAGVFDEDPEWMAHRKLRSVHVRGIDEGGEEDEAVTVDIRTAWVVPFALDVVAKVLRERSDRTTIQSQCADFQTLEEKDRVLVSLFSGGAEFEKGGNEMAFRGRIVSRYYPEPANARVLIVSELSVEPVGSTDTSPLSYAVHSQGWIRLQGYRPDGASLQSATTQALTQIQWLRSVRILPRSLGVGSRRPHQVGVFTETVLSHIQRDLDESQQALEDLLLEDDADNELSSLEGLGTTASTASLDPSSTRDHESAKRDDKDDPRP